MKTKQLYHLQSKLYKALLFALLLCSFVPAVLTYAQDDVPPVASAPVLRFTHLTIEDGLSHSVVTAFLQDSQGFMWIGTESGLNRYDGYTFTVYRYDPDNVNSLSDNHVTGLYQDAEGVLWISTQGGGINRFDPLTETFTRYQNDPQNPNSPVANASFSIFQDSRGELWFGAPAGLTRFDPTTGTFTRYLHQQDSPQGFQGGAVWSMVEDENGQLWMAADQVLAKFDPDTDQFTYYDPGTGDRRLATLYQDQAGIIWIGGSEGLYQFDPAIASEPGTQTGTFILYQPGHAFMIHDILGNEDGTFWIATQADGLYLFDSKTKQFTHQYTHNTVDRFSLSYDRVVTLYRDRAGVLWIGTNEGVNLYSPRQSQFTHYRHDPEHPDSLADGAVWGISGDGDCTESEGQIWIGTGATLNQFDLATGTVIRHFLGDLGPDAADEGDIYCDPDGFVWAGVGSWLYRLDKTSGEIEPFDLQAIRPSGSPPFEITAFYRVGSALWIGARPGGLFRFDLNNETAQALFDVPPELKDKADPHMPLGIDITALYGDREGMIWIGYSSAGLSRFDPQTETFTHYAQNNDNPQSRPGNWITDIYQDQVGVMWITSRHGLTRFDPEEKTFTLYTEKDGLGSAYVTGIQQDQNGDLWLATAKGLSRFDLEKQTFRNFDIEDGLGSTEFSGASWQSADGRMFFGSKDGLTTFYPDQISDNPYQPPVVLTGFYLFNKPISIEKGGLLERPIWATDQLTLEHDQTWISFEFAALSYAAPHKNHYRYMLEGDEADWNEVNSDHRLATYTRIPAGEYTFRVQGANEDGIWSSDEVTLAITVLPAWWETGWFRGAIALLLVGLVIGGVRWRTRTLQQRSRDLQVQVEERTQELVARTERLQVSEERFREMSGLLPNAVVEMDADLNVTYVNQSGLELFGQTQQDVGAGVNAMDRLHPEDRERAVQRIATYLEGKYVPPTEYRILKKDGTEIPVLLNASPIRREGKVVGFRASITDIRQIKEAEKAVRASEEQLRFVTDSIPAYIAYVGLDDLCYRFVSNKFEQAYAMPREKIIGQHIRDIIGESNYQFALPYIDLVRSGQAVSYENVFEVEEGKRWIEVNYVPTLDERGEPEGIAVLSFDITSRKLAEEALRESQEQFELFMKMLPHGVFIKEEDSTVIYVNQYIKDVLGGGHWLGKDAHAAFPEYPELAEAMMTDDRNALAQGQTRVEEAMPDKDGHERVFVTTKFRISRANKPPLLGGIGLDITDRVKAERELAAALDTARQLQDEAEAANQAKSVFLANMSHELRTPLNAILGYAQLMVRDAQLTSVQRERLETIVRSGEHLLSLINDVLTMSKIEAGRTTLQENAFDLHRQLYGLQEMFQMRTTEKGLTLHLEIAPDVPPYICADEGKLREVLMNLLSNAVKFTQEGGIVLRVGCQPQTADDPSLVALRIEVEDTGVGIAPDELDALFDPFVQTASGQQSQEGTGLGLPISRQFIELMGGELSVNSVIGKGTTFRVQIPVSLAEADQAQAIDWGLQRRVTGIEPGQTAPDGGPFRLLIVEDRLTNRDVLLEMLRPFGFELRCATNGAEGVELWEAWQPHLVWMDMRMPVMDGYEATRQIKAQAKATGRHSIIVALTASAFEEDRETILAAGCDDFVRKPFRESRIFDVLQRHLGVRFIYECDLSAPKTAAGASLEDLRAAVNMLPAEWAANLYQAIVALDDSQMLALIESIRPDAPHLADTLAQWVRDLEYDRLLALIQ